MEPESHKFPEIHVESPKQLNEINLMMEDFDNIRYPFSKERENSARSLSSNSSDLTYNPINQAKNLMKG